MFYYLKQHHYFRGRLLKFCQDGVRDILQMRTPETSLLCKAKFVRLGGVVREVGMAVVGGSEGKVGAALVVGGTSLIGPCALDLGLAPSLSQLTVC